MEVLRVFKQLSSWVLLSAVSTAPWALSAGLVAPPGQDPVLFTKWEAEQNGRACVDWDSTPGLDPSPLPDGLDWVT